MKPIRTRLLEARRNLGLPWEVLERDYLLSWMLAGIAQVDSPLETLVFKGGTALKKCYFGDYRFSEDLDFSGLEAVPTGRAMETAVREACGAAARLLHEYAPGGDRLRAIHGEGPASGRPGGLHDPRALPLAEAAANACHDRDLSG